MKKYIPSRFVHYLLLNLEFSSKSSLVILGKIQYANWRSVYPGIFFSIAGSGWTLPRMPCFSSPLKIASWTRRDRKPNSLATMTAPLVSILPDGRMSLFGLPPRCSTSPPCHQERGDTTNASFMSATGR